MNLDEVSKRVIAIFERSKKDIPFLSEDALIILDYCFSVKELPECPECELKKRFGKGKCPVSISVPQTEGS